MRSALCYGAECWALRVDERKLRTTEMRMLPMCEKTKKDDISNQTIRDMTGGEKIEEFIREQRLRWFGHVERINDERTPGKKFYSCWLKERQTQEEMKKSCRKGHAGCRYKKNQYIRSLFMEAWLQKLARPCLQRKQARFQEDKDIYQRKMKTLSMFKCKKNALMQNGDCAKKTFH